MRLILSQPPNAKQAPGKPLPAPGDSEGGGNASVRVRVGRDSVRAVGYSVRVTGSSGSWGRVTVLVRGHGVQ